MVDVTIAPRKHMQGFAEYMVRCWRDGKEEYVLADLRKLTVSRAAIYVSAAIARKLGASEAERFLDQVSNLPTTKIAEELAYGDEDK